MTDTNPMPLDDLPTTPQGPFFRFPDEVTGRIELDNAGLLDAEGEPITASHNHALDVIGEITRGGEWDADGNMITPPVLLDGWHINYQGPLPEGWEQYVVSPVNPVRVFLGAPTQGPDLGQA